MSASVTRAQALDVRLDAAAEDDAYPVELRRRIAALLPKLKIAVWFDDSIDGSGRVEWPEKHHNRNMSTAELRDWLVRIAEARGWVVAPRSTP